MHSEGHASALRALAVVAAMLGAMLAAAPADAQSGGERTVKVPYDLAAFGGIGFDPTTVPSPADWYVQQWIYDSLLRQNADGSYSPGLAKSAKVVDPQTIEIELRPNQKFSDGTPLDADAVKFSIERTKASGNVGCDPRRAQRDLGHHRRQPDQAHDQPGDAGRRPVLQPARQR